MENLSCHSNQSTWATIIKNLIYVEANVMNIYAKFQLHPQLLRGRFFFFFFRKFSLSVAMKISDLDKIHMVGRGLLQKHFCKTFVKISAVTQK